jgi:hypothetical protein
MLLLSSAKQDRGRCDAVDDIPVSDSLSTLCDTTDLQNPGCEESLMIEGQDKEVVEQSMNTGPLRVTFDWGGEQR